MSDELVSKYIKIQKSIQDLEKKHREQIASLESDLESVTKKLLDACEKDKRDVIKTSVGTVTRKTRVTYTTADRESMYHLIKKHSAYNLLEKRIHVSNMKQFLESNSKPDFINVNKTYSLSVVKPK